MNDFGRGGNDGEVEGDEGGGGEGIGDAALEDEVDVHEAVPDDGPGEGKGQEDEGEADDVLEDGVYRDVEQEGNDVEQGEGDDGDQGAAGKPLELLALERVFRAAGAQEEECGGGDVVEGHVGHGDLVEAVLEGLGGGPEEDGSGLEGGEVDAGEVEQGGEDGAGGAAGGIGWSVREGDGEVEEERGLEEGREDFRPVDDLVEGVEFAGVLEGVEDEGGEAEDVEVGGFGCGPAAEEDVEADAEVDEGDEAEAVVDGTVGGLEDNFDGELWRAGSEGAGVGGSGDGVGGLAEDAVAKDLALIGGDTGGEAVIDGLKDVSGADSGALAGGVGGDLGGAEAAGGFSPPDAVCWGVVGVFRGQVEASEDTCAESDGGQHDGEDSGLKDVLHSYADDLPGAVMHVQVQT